MSDLLAAHITGIGGVAPISNPLTGGQIFPTPSIGIQPEPAPPPVSDEMLLAALTLSYDAFQRLAYKTPRFNPDALIQAKGYDAIDALLTMSVYNSPLRLVKMATLYKEPQTLPRYLSPEHAPDRATYDRAQEAADLCRHVVNNIYDPETGEHGDLRTVLWYALDAVHIGFSIQEIIWRYLDSGTYKGKWGLTRFAFRRPKAITFNLDPRTLKVMSLNNFTPLAGWQTNLNLEKFLFYTFQPRDALPYGWGVGRVCYKHTFTIDELIRTWGIGLQRFGTGFLKAETANTSEGARTQLRQLLDNVANGGSLVVPQGLIVELMNLPGGTLSVFANALQYHQDQIVQNILGSTLTTQAGSGEGSYALGGVHADTREYFLAYPRKDIEMLVEKQLYTRIVAYNLGPAYADVVPRHSQGVWNYQELQQLANVRKVYLDAGVIHPAEQFLREEAGMPPPQALSSLPTIAPGDPHALPAAA
jgi:hypothetical protein